MSASRDVARRRTHEALVHDGDLQEVLGQRARLQIVIIGLADATQEAHRARPAQLKLQHAEHEALRLEDLVDRVATVDHVDDLTHRRAVDLLVLGGHEDGRGADELQLAERDDLAREEAIDVVDAQEEGLWEEREAMVDLDEPVHEHGAHRPLDLGLVVHVVGVGQHLDLRDAVGQPMWTVKLDDEQQSKARHDATRFGPQMWPCLLTFQDSPQALACKQKSHHHTQQPC